MKNANIPMIIPTIPKDYSRVKRNYKKYFDFLPISRIIFIGPKPLEEIVMSDAETQGYSDRVDYLDENSIIPFDDLKTAMIKRIRAEGYEMDENSKPGWYYQQFLKMAYAYICDEEYYISWDSDTLPLRKIKMFNDKGKPYLDTKAEYNPGYFRTIRNLFGLEKAYERSFIAEHMLFNKEYMLELINEISALKLDGDTFYEKIFHAIDIDNMKLGFSEFETYGTWLLNRHPNAYAIRLWKSMRKANLFVDSHNLTEGDIKWLAKDYDAASFESYHPLVPELANIFKDPKTRNNVSAKEMYLKVTKSGLFGEYVDGMIREGDLYSPI
ncbi:MAG: DUF6492 family protein [Lachnospiraceae bacterium]|nr:DUF6492 family protein [Lachnospiraceae bacterium]